ncbi:MAG: AI-2E family transporter [Desulfovibrionaceae bacterium]|nr:AI-2E family transporter [Desulfovibrionaceae bacterium]
MTVEPDNNSRPLFSNRIYSYFLGALLLASLYLAFFIMGPFLTTLVFSAVVAMIFYPVFTRINGLLRGRKNLAAIATVVIIVFTIVIPTFVLIFGLISQGIETVSAINAWLTKNGLSDLIGVEALDRYALWIKDKLPFVKLETLDLQARVLEMSRLTAQFIIQQGTSLVGNMARLALHFLLLIVVVFHFLRDGEAMLCRIKFLCPLRPTQEDILIDSLRRVAKSVILGSLVIAVLQGLVGGIALYVVGIPGFFWGAIMGFSSLIPIVGTGLVWVPAVVYLVFSGQYGSAVFLGLWCGILVVGIDTLLRPILLREASRVSVFFVFLAVLGGVAAFGFKGILYGPLILSLVMVMLDFYGEEYKDVLTACPAFSQDADKKP